MAYYRRCANGCMQPRFEEASQAEYSYGNALAASSPSALSTAAAVSASSSAVAVSTGAPLLSIPGADTRPPLSQVSTTDPTGSATPGGGHRSTALSKQDAKLFGTPAFGQSGASWGNSFCQMGTTPAAFVQSGEASPFRAFLGFAVAGCILAAVLSDATGRGR